MYITPRDETVNKIKNSTLTDKTANDEDYLASIVETLEGIEAALHTLHYDIEIVNNEFEAMFDEYYAPMLAAAKDTLNSK